MSSRGSSWSRPALVMVLYLGMGAVGLAIGTLRGEPNLWRLAGQDDPQVLASVLAGLAVGLSFVFVSRLAVTRFEWARALHREFRAMLSPLADYEIFVLAAASSVGEELLFRGALVPALGLWGSSAVFALLHIGPTRRMVRYLPWTASSFAAGAIFGAIFLWTGDLTGAVLAHFTVNFLNLRHVAQWELR